MNNILKISLTVLFAISTVFSAVGGAKTTQGKKAQSDGGNFSYLTVAKELSKLPKVLSVKEKKVVNDFISGKSQNIRDLSHLESAIKKHPCFVQKNKKGKNLTIFPKHGSKPHWFTLDCNASKGKAKTKSGGPKKKYSGSNK
tara:strand:+ start:583 stop:1008 length:426 start_codon:yes stop_codon:yes gene_type:complete